MDPTNTTDQPPESHLLGLMSGSDTYIEDMEARGQLELVRSEMLPAELLYCTEADFEALGFVFGEPATNDPMFRHVTLPEGWTKQATDHSMWSKVVDQRGIERVAVFYKAAFYDRRAHMNLTNVGRAVARMAANGEQWTQMLEQLTDEERAETRQALANELERAVEHLDFWAGEKDGSEHAERQQASIERLKAALAEVPA